MPEPGHAAGLASFIRDMYMWYGFVLFTDTLYRLLETYKHAMLILYIHAIHFLGSVI